MSQLPNPKAEISYWCFVSYWRQDLTKTHVVQASLTLAVLPLPRAPQGCYRYELQCQDRQSSFGVAGLVWASFNRAFLELQTLHRNVSGLIEDPLIPALCFILLTHKIQILTTRNRHIWICVLGKTLFIQYTHPINMYWMRPGSYSAGDTETTGTCMWDHVYPTVKTVSGLWEGWAGKGTRCRVWQPDFTTPPYSPLDPHSRRKASSQRARHQEIAT